jgi:hypothetical protein
MTNATTNNNLQGPSDVYSQMLEVVSKKRGFVSVSKKHLKSINVSWSFVEKSAEILGLQILRHGNFGYEICRK